MDDPLNKEAADLQKRLAELDPKHQVLFAESRVRPMQIQCPGGGGKDSVPAGRGCASAAKRRSKACVS